MNRKEDVAMVRTASWVTQSLHGDPVADFWEQKVVRTAVEGKMP
jgi:hypothetical protein